MEIDQNQDSEMAEISNIYDPEPVVPMLKENSAITIAFQVLRSEVNKYRTRKELQNFNPEELYTSLRENLPDLPTSIYDTIEEYVIKLGFSVENWLREHYKLVFFFYYGRRTYVLYDFDDFVIDSAGGIDFVKTAERMVRCDRFNDVVKFKVACMYCFEDDVRRIWPSVWKQVGLDQIQFNYCPQLYYWICRLNNQLNMIPLPPRNGSIEGEMFDACITSTRTSWEYFWNRLPPEIQLRKALYFVNGRRPKDELILRKLDDRQLGEFVKQRGCDLMYSNIRDDNLEEGLFHRIWMLIKRVMDEDVFGELIVDILRFECERKKSGTSWGWPSYGQYEFGDYIKNDHKEWLCRSREVWSSAPHNLRISVLKNILPNLRLYKSNRRYNYKPKTNECRNEEPVNFSEFLFTILSDASLKERNSFWCNCWHNLILSANFDDLQRVMEKCFENNDAIVEFKENVIARNGIVRQICVSLLTHAHFEELNEHVNFFSANLDSAKNYKRQLLQSSFLGETSIFPYRYFSHAKQFDKFISDAYGNVDLATDFKNQLMSSPATELILPKEAFTSHTLRIDEFTEFMELFVSTEEMMQQKKKRIVDHLREVALTDPATYESYLGPGLLLGEVLLWCLGSRYEVFKFNKSVRSSR